MSHASHRGTVLACLAVVAGMVGLSYAAVPLYDLFCRMTGFGARRSSAPGPPARCSTARWRSGSTPT